MKLFCFAQFDNLNHINERLMIYPLQGCKNVQFVQHNTELEWQPWGHSKKNFCISQTCFQCVPNNYCFAPILLNMLQGSNSVCDTNAAFSKSFSTIAWWSL